MCKIRSVIVLITYFWFVVMAKNSSKDAIGFPEVEENPLIANKQNRVPVFIPSMCPENELFYPGDQRDDWICDCRPGNLYHPNSDACWPAYQRGPCAYSEYLILPTDTVIPICKKNPCIIDTMVPWKGNCQKLGSTVACGVDKFPTEALWVNATSLNIECLQINTEYRFNIDYFYEKNVTCCPGCKRYVQNKCP
nr:uncharacterized protein LOC113396087 [Vanessa tameamea]